MRFRAPVCALIALCLFVKYPRIYKDDVTYRLPDGMTVESKPDNADLSWPERAVMKVQVAQVKAGVQVDRVLAYNFTIVDPKRYGELHEFYQKVAAADQQQVVLTRAAVAR